MEPSTNQTFRQKVTRDDEEYNMRHSGGRGIAVIFGFSKYENDAYPIRQHMENEITTMKKAYKALGFREEEIVCHRNLETDDIKKEIETLKKEDYSNYDCLSVTILSHGEEDCFITHDSLYPLKDFIQSIADVPSLVGKPKIFFVQFCRGDEYNSGTQFGHPASNVDQGGDGDVIDGGYVSYTLPSTADLLIALSTTKGFVSFHSKKTPFITHLSNVLESSDKEKEDLVSMIVTANRGVATTFVSNNFGKDWHNKKQMPTLITTLTRKIFFRSDA